MNEFNGGRFTRDGAGKFANLRHHAAGYHTIRRWSRAPISTAHAYTHWMPRRAHDVLDQAAAAMLDALTNEFWFHAIRTGELVAPYSDGETAPEVKGTCDYWAINYYTRGLADARRANPGDGTKPSYAIDTTLPWRGFYSEELHPDGLLAALDRLHDRPVVITENGVAAADDRFRIVWLAHNLAAAAEGMARGCDLRAYLHWSTFDNYEWYSYGPRFGLVDVDFASQRRTPKPSAAFYRDIIAANGCTPELIARHLPSMPSVVDVTGRAAIALAAARDLNPIQSAMA